MSSIYPFPDPSAIHAFTFDGVPSTDFGLYVGGQNTFNSPLRDVTKVSIAGRNGDLVRDNGRFLNVQVAYNIVAMYDFVETAKAVRNWLLSVKGYARLEDTYHPDHFRMARVSDTIMFETSAFNHTGKAQIVFDCMPQRFLLDGEFLWLIPKNASEENRTLENPTPFESRPLIKVWGTGDGTVTVGNQIITLTGIDEYLDIDSETMNCYKGTTNCNSKVALGAKGFPVLPSGNTTFAMTGDVQRIEVAGRWWEL